VAVRHGFEP